MEEGLGNKVYSKNIIEFVTVAKEFCAIAESVRLNTKLEFLQKVQKIFPLLYLKMSVIEKYDALFDDGNEKFVVQDDWDYVKNSVKEKLGQHDDYLEVFHPDMHLTEAPIASSISENIADIYQDLKDFISLYALGNEEIMNDAIWECQLNFEEYWGQKLTNSLRAVHMVLYSGDNLSDEANKNEENEARSRDTSNWIIQKRQNDFYSDEI